MHPRNRFHEGYDFARLVARLLALAAFVKPSGYGALTIDFANPAAVKALNQALLLEAYGIADWDIPAGYLCPPVPGRSDYVHHVADLLADGGEVPRGGGVRVLDVGTGANGIYPLIGAAEYGWRFVGTEVDPVACEWVSGLFEKASAEAGALVCAQQRSATECFKGVMLYRERFDVTMCNPPFHGSAEEAASGTRRKQRNLTGKLVAKARLNFGGQAHELWCEGGERAFIGRMIQQRREVAESAGWFRTLVSKADSLKPLRGMLERVAPAEVRVVEMTQGQKKRRMLAWRF